MQTGSRLVVVAWFLLTVAIYLPFAVLGNDEGTGTISRMKLFINVEELKEYLHLVKDYYNLNAKGRYGKRSKVSRDLLDVLKYPPKPLLFKQRILQPAYRNNEAKNSNVQQGPKYRQWLQIIWHLHQLYGN